jgi:O-antigen/teichoic acid export membrane protein
MDKLLLSRLLPLDVFGYYTLAWTLASVLSYLSAPVTTALFPRLVQAHNQHQPQELARLYHLGCQVTGVLVLPVASVLICYAQPLLHAWTRDADIASHSALLLQLLAVGCAINLSLAMSYSLQAAIGWNRLVFWVHAVSIPVMAGMLLTSSLRWGSAGGAACWVALYVMHIAVGPYVMHQRILAGEYRTWLWRDLLAPAMGGVAAVLTMRMALPAPASTAGIAAASAGAWLAGVAAQSACSQQLRPYIREFVLKRFRLTKS